MVLLKWLLVDILVIPQLLLLNECMALRDGIYVSCQEKEIFEFRD